MAHERLATAQGPSAEARLTMELPKRHTTSLYGQPVHKDPRNQLEYPCRRKRRASQASLFAKLHASTPQLMQEAAQRRGPAAVRPRRLGSRKATWEPRARLRSSFKNAALPVASSHRDSPLAGQHRTDRCAKWHQQGQSESRLGRGAAGICQHTGAARALVAVPVTVYDTRVTRLPHVGHASGRPWPAPGQDRQRPGGPRSRRAFTGTLAQQQPQAEGDPSLWKLR